MAYGRYCYEKGIGTIEDEEKAFSCFLKSAEGENRGGQNIKIFRWIDMPEELFEFYNSTQVALKKLKNLQVSFEFIDEKQIKKCLL
ncbi:hypothetical protein Glove_81g59 [Diversispora epigaea]|uniref:Uncharacterized protein n=1 Tax=Diversispora epigaea TaxID=1348612 RepID=A0A397JEU2_9GLOM|nr:hypothetical protein Glove_81g59 [Diversispora epigaea]